MAYDADLDYLRDYAQQDWVGLSPVAAVAGHMAGEGATFDALLAAMLTVVSDLIDGGAVPGDLTDADPAFRPWTGTKGEVLGRVAAETRALGRLPESGEVCFIHGPATD